MKDFLQNLALPLAVCLAFGLFSHFFGVWQGCVLILLVLTAFFAFRGLTRLEVLSRQLSNLYVLTAWKGVPPLESKQAPAQSEELLDAWEKLNRYRFLGNGVTLGQADSAAFAELQKQRRWIAAHNAERIENGCVKRSSFSDSEPGPELPKKELCPGCAKAYAEAKQQWDEVLASEKMGKFLSPHEYPVWHPRPRCPLLAADNPAANGTALW
jgi:hypothetical protein